MSRAPLTVVKIGGKPAEDNELVSLMAAELDSLQESGRRILLVHGGGITISDLQGKFGVVPVFESGLRQTPPPEMVIVDMALSGGVNKRLVRLLRTAGVNAWGLCGADGGVLTAASVSGDPNINRTGAVASVDTRPLELLWNGGFVPVFAPPATDTSGNAINVNADEAALHLSAEAKADQLIYISDVPGVLEESKIIRQLTPELIEEKIASGIISGGMIPKVRSAVEALQSGVRSVYIGDYSGMGNLGDILSGKRGTCIDSGDTK